MTQHIPSSTHCHHQWLDRHQSACFASALILALLQATVRAAPVLLQGRIVRVTDGDTVTLMDAHHILHKIRLAGIDAPESKMPYGHQATAFLTALTLGRDVDALAYKQDRYGRTVATLIVDNKGRQPGHDSGGAGVALQALCKGATCRGGEGLRAGRRTGPSPTAGPVAGEAIEIAPWEWRAMQGRSRTHIGGAIMLGAQAAHDRINP
jgi:hypothetical protein